MQLTLSKLFVSRLRNFRICSEAAIIVLHFFVGGSYFFCKKGQPFAALIIISLEFNLIVNDLDQLCL